MIKIHVMKEAYLDKRRFHAYPGSIVNVIMDPLKETFCLTIGWIHRLICPLLCRKLANNKKFR